MKRRRRVTHARLCKLLDYDDQTGEFRWRESVKPSIQPGDIAGTMTNQGYRRITVEGRPYPAHQLAWFYKMGKWCALSIDHRDGNPSNNRWNNLRRATSSQNSANRPAQRNNVCGLKGVATVPHGWRATIRKNRRTYYLGMFRTPEAAHAAYIKAAHKLFGEFARTE
jgi:HNH endonuclease/AP2 domain